MRTAGWYQAKGSSRGGNKKRHWYEPGYHESMDCNHATENPLCKKRGRLGIPNDSLPMCQNCLRELARINRIGRDKAVKRRMTNRQREVQIPA